MKSKRVLVTGGTGSFGTKIIHRLLASPVESVIVFSRDEDKQFHMRNQIKDPRLLFTIGDVRDAARINEVMRQHPIDIVFHAAALKQVPYCEDHPYEAIKTNIIGAHNVKTAAIENGVSIVVGISTDKAVKPVNAMGMSKALQEKILLSENDGITRFICVRYGNVIGSRGSVIPFFRKLIESGEKIPITDAAMTRFLLTLDEAIDLVFFATFVATHRNAIYVMKMPACQIMDLAKLMGRELAKDNFYIHVVGIRPGEKVHELLISEEEMRRTEDCGRFFIIHPFGTYKSKLKGEYGSNTTRLLDFIDLKELLHKEEWM